MHFPSLSAVPERLRLASIAVVSALLGGLLVVTGALPANADGGLTLDADASSTILVGNVADVSLTASNSSGTDEYNASFRVVLPAGVSYRAGTTSPEDAGDPQVIQATDASGNPTTTTLLWSNVGDLLAADTTTLSFRVLADPNTYPVGSSFSLDAGVYTSGNARTLPKFTAAGQPVPDTTAPVYSATTTTEATRATALSIEKDEPSPESELMRGVHDHPTVYTIRVQNTKEAPTEDVTVDDYLPAGLEFLQCGGIDNTSAGTVEYPGAPRLTETTATTTGTECTGNVPALVETVQDPEGYPAGVYTHVRWSIGTLAGGTGDDSRAMIQYVAAVPLRENTMTFAGGTPATTGAQAANLDNNTGSSTRQDGAATTWTNRATTTGQYTGAVASDADRTSTATASEVIEASDLSIVKSTGETGFVAGTKRTYSLLLRSSEYVSDSAMTITDVVDDGLCPVFPADLTPTVTPAGSSLPADCDPAVTPSMAGDASNGAITAVAYDADSGKFTTTIRPSDDTIGRSGSSTITYDVLQRLRYSAPGQDGPTSAGDSFSNHVDIDGTSTSQPGLGVESGTKAVRDDSGTTIQTGETTIDKRVLPRTDGPITSAADCAAEPSTDYVDTTDPAPFRLGDQVCFQLAVQFPSSTDTRNARVQDLVPVGTTYAGAVRGTESTVPAEDVDGSRAGTDATTPTWSIGHPIDGATGTYVTKGQRLVLYVMATVTGQGSSATTPDLVDNLMKYRQTNTAGKAVSLRDSVGYRVAGSPVVSLGKSIVSRNGAAITPTTRTSTAEGQVLGYRLTVTNAGTDAAGNAIPLAGVTVWDRLPVGITADDVTADSGTPTDTAPAGAADTDRSYVVWTLPDDLEPGTPVTLDYTVQIPQGVSVSTALTNDASVTRFTTADNAGGSTTWRPADSLDTRAPGTGAGTAPAANASATATLADATVTKDATAVADTSLTNASGGIAVQGQDVDFDYAVTVPARTSVYDGVLSDPRLQDLQSSGLPLTGTAEYTLTTPDGTPWQDGDDVTYGGSSFRFVGGVLTFPTDTAFDNATDAAVTFTVHVTGLHVTSGAPLRAFTNTARFTSANGPGGAALPARTDNASVTVAAPAPAITKRADSATITAGGRAVFTLEVSNTSSVDAQDGLVVDCLPDGLTVSDDQPPLPTEVRLATPAQLAEVDCGSATAVGWTLDSALARGTAIAIQLVVDVESSAAGKRSYDNTARFVTSSLRDGARNAADEGVQQVSSKAVRVTVAGASVTKQVAVGDGAPAASGTGPAGQSTTYTVTATLPANVNFYRAAVFDTLPDGMVLSDTPSCSASDGITCTPGTAAGQNESGDSVVFFTLGNVASAPTERTVTLTVPVTVPTDADAGQVYRNTGHLGWSTTASGAQPTGPDAAFDETADSTTVPVTAQRPALTIAKQVSSGTPAPGDTFTYTVQVTNASGATHSTAYDTEVVDCVPAGVRILTTGGGTLGGATTDPTCGSTITWSIASIDVGGTRTLTYTAQLVDSARIDTTAQQNTVGVTEYWSLPAASGGRYDDVAPKSATVRPSFPKVAITKSGAAGPAYIGTPYGWTVTFTNTGSAGKDLRPTDVLPKGWTYVKGSSTLTRSGTTTAISDPAVTGSGTQTLRWASLGAVPNGTTTLRYTATPTDAVRTDPGVGSSVPQTNTVSADVTDGTNATANASGPYSPDQKTATAHIDQADLVLTKSGVDREPVAGQSGPQDAWTIVVRNAGGDTAVGPFTVSDTPQDLPAGAVVTGASGTGWTCATPTADGRFTCTTTAGTTLAVGASLPTITVQVSLASSVPAGTALVNSASVTARTADGTPGNATDEGTVTTDALADLRIVKTGAASIQAGTATSWRLQASNAGPSDAAGPVTVTDTLPAGVTVTDVDGAGLWQCTTPDGTDAQEVTCTLPDGLAVGQTVPAITITGLVASGTTGELTNDAVIASRDTPDPSRGDNSSSVTTPVGVGTALTVTKTLRGDFVPGEQATYRVTVTNSGTADATGVVVRDPLPAGLTFVRAEDVTGTWTQDTTSSDPRFTLGGSIVAGKSAVIDLVVAVAPDLRGDVVNTAVAEADNADEASGRWTSSTTPLTDLSITKSHAVDSVVAGTDLDWTIIVRNEGPSDIAAGTDTTTVTDQLPEGVTYVGATGDAAAPVGDAGGWTTSGPDADGLVTWTSTGGATVGTAFPTLTVRVHVASGTDASTLTNTAVVDGTNATGSVRSDPDTVPVEHQAAVTIAKTLDDGPVVAGTDAHFTITVTNAGPSDARALTVTDLVPAGMTLTDVSSTDDAWTCGDDGCTRERMAPGQSTIAVTARVASDFTGTLTNRAEVSWTDDAGHTEDTEVDVPTRAVAGVTLTKRAVDRDGSASTSVAPGTTQRWLLTVHNDGPSDAVGPVVVRDTLPEGLTWAGLAQDTTIAGANEGWTCVPDGQVVDCTSDAPVVAGQDAQAPLVIATTVDAALPAGTIENTASVSTGTTSTTPASSSGSVVAAPLANVSITLSHTGEGTIGSPTPFTATVRNDGPSQAVDVHTTITLPAGLTFDGTVGTDPAWTAGEPVRHADGTTTIEFTLTGPLAPGATAPAIVVSAVVGPDAYPSATVGAAVTTATTETTTADNTATDPLAVAPLSSLSVTKTHTQALERGGTVGYTIVVSNGGPTADPGPVRVTDALPEGLSLVSVDGRGDARCTTGDTVVCTLTGPLAVGASVTIDLTAKVASDAPDRIVNTAVVSTPTAQTTIPGGDGGGLSASDPAPVRSAPTGPVPPVLAFTGAQGLGLLVGLALLAMALGFGTLAYRRRRSL